jgi:hypothetical protein
MPTSFAPGTQRRVFALTREGNSWLTGLAKTQEKDNDMFRSSRQVEKKEPLRASF